VLATFERNTPVLLLRTREERGGGDVESRKLLASILILRAREVERRWQRWMLKRNPPESCSCVRRRWRGVSGIKWQK
jgi:hypothetical protein